MFRPSSGYFCLSLSTWLLLLDISQYLDLVFRDRTISFSGVIAYWLKYFELIFTYLYLRVIYGMLGCRMLITVCVMPLGGSLELLLLGFPNITMDGRWIYYAKQDIFPMREQNSYEGQASPCKATIFLLHIQKAPGLNIVMLTHYIFFQSKCCDIALKQAVPHFFQILPSYHYNTCSIRYSTTK